MSELSDLYQEVILDHSRHPHNYHAMADATRLAKGHNPLCGDEVTVYVKFADDKIQDISFEGHGCAISKSSASVMTDTVKGKTIGEFLELFEKFRAMVTVGAGSHPRPPSDPTDKLAVFSGVSEFPTRVKCASLAWHTLKSAMENKKQTTTEGL